MADAHSTPPPLSPAVAPADVSPLASPSWLLDSLGRHQVDQLHRIGRLLRPLAAVAYRREVVRANLARLFPQREVDELVERFYDNFALTVSETARSLAMSRSELDERVQVAGAEALEETGGLLLTAHFGNLVWSVTALGGLLSIPVACIYKPPHVPMLGAVLRTIASRFDIRLLPHKPAAALRSHLLRSRGQRSVLVVAADQRPGPNRRTVPFFGRPTDFHGGPERLAQFLDWPVYYLSCRSIGAGRYRCTVERLAAPPHAPDAITVAYAAKLQAEIERAPEAWLWSHNRWRGGDGAPRS